MQTCIHIYHEPIPGTTEDRTKPMKAASLEAISLAGKKPQLTLGSSRFPNIPLMAFLKHPGTIATFPRKATGGY